MRNNVVVVMFCGPRTKSGFPSALRILKAIEVAQSSRCKLFIVGADTNKANNESFADIDMFKSMAIEHGVDTAAVHVPATEANTRTNAEAIAHAIAKPKYANLIDLCLVTDHWHMPRALLHMKDALARVSFPSINLIPINVTSAQKPEEAVLEREKNLRAKFEEEIRARRK